MLRAGKKGEPECGAMTISRRQANRLRHFSTAATARVDEGGFRHAYMTTASVLTA
jgi:hypothetical protein